jgi:signal transduction histidine kinase
MSYLAIVTLISICFSVVIYQVAARDLTFGLRRQTQRIYDNFPVFSDSPYLRMGEDINEGKSHLIGRLVLLNMVVISTAGVASYALARRTLKPIEEAHERQKRFTADVSHELRTPLTALKMESEVALMDPAATKADLKAVITSNVEEAQKLTNLVSNLLRLSQLDDSEKSKLLHSTSLNQAVTSAVEQLQPMAQARNISLSSTLSTDVTVRGDAAMLSQLLIILIDNAIKYSPGGSTVTITTELKQQLAHVRISDTGKGIAKADLEHVFDRFYRADSSRTSNETSSGFGLGLSIAKLIADSHNATISLTSQLKKGTTATVIIPANMPKQPADQQPVISTSQS